MFLGAVNEVLTIPDHNHRENWSCIVLVLCAMCGQEQEANIGGDCRPGKGMK
jgi:hypothetical protein